MSTNGAILFIYTEFNISHQHNDLIDFSKYAFVVYIFYQIFSCRFYKKKNTKENKNGLSDKMNETDWKKILMITERVHDFKIFAGSQKKKIIKLTYKINFVVMGFLF